MYIGLDPSAHMEMEFTLTYYQFGLCLFSGLLFHAILRAISSAAANQPRPRLPPGPWQLPIIGNLPHLLSGFPHRAVRDLSLRHGPLMKLRLCERLAIVVSSAEAAREIYKGNEAAFSQRLSSPGIDELSRHGEGIIFAPYGDHWRLLRRILMTELLSARAVDAFRRIREEEVARLLSSLHASGGRLVNMDERIEEFVTGSAMRAIFGDALPQGAAFLKVVKQGLNLTSLFDLRDLFPSSRLVRLLLPRSGGKPERHRQELFRNMDNILKTRQERRAAKDDGHDQHVFMVDVLLRIQKEDNNMRVSLSLTDGVIRALLIDVFGAALDTTITTIQWAMAELMANPRVMQRLQSQIGCVLAEHAIVEEGAPKDMEYLRAVIKETLRLHPPAPLLPRVCLQDYKIHGYDIPQGVIVLTNIWAISRDPKYWDEPDKFMPERFEGEGAADFRGADFEFTPFGVGRRICSGIGFAFANIEIALCSLLYHFDLKLPPGVEPKDVDRTEVFGASVGKQSKLFLHSIPRATL